MMQMYYADCEKWKPCGGIVATSLTSDRGSVIDSRDAPMLHFTPEWSWSSRRLAMQLDPNDIAELTTLIFAAALNPARWIDFLEKLHTFTGGVRTHIFGRDMATGRLFGHIGVGYDDSHMTGYDQHYRHLNVWVDGFAPSARGTFMRVAEMYPLEQLFRTEFYNDWVKPQDDMYGGGGVMLFNEADRFLAFGGHIRARDREKLDDRFECLVRMLTPHVQQAFEINRALHGKAIAEFLAEAVLPPSTGVLLLNSRQGILFANHAAENLIAAGALIRAELNGCLGTDHPKVQDFLERAVRSLSEIEHPASTDLRIVSGRLGVEYFLRAARFVADRQHQSPFGLLHSGDSRALLLTIEVKPLNVGPLEDPFRQHRLTPSEVQVARDLAHGVPVAEIAERRGVSVHTIRNQRHAILSKLDLRSQTQLVRLVLEFDRR